MKGRVMLISSLSLMMLACLACNGNNKTTLKQEKEITVQVPIFDADSAYNFVKTQVDFGPRMPNTKQHEACGDYLAKQLESYGAQVTNQYADLARYDGVILKARNIIGSYKPESKKRLLLFAHWDTRPWADNDKDPANRHTPILGANDAASGVGVLLEIARLIHIQQPELGIDIIFFDAEDSGTPQFYEGKHKDNTWCLGSQYWSRNPHVDRYNARFGILLDMVGGKQATFLREAYSVKYAKPVVNKVWSKANELGYGAFFINENRGLVTDDHVSVNEVARIPSIDIIPCDEANSDLGFGSFWHTIDDTMEVIDRSTLKAVGQTVLEVIYNEK